MHRDPCKGSDEECPRSLCVRPVSPPPIKRERRRPSPRRLAIPSAPDRASFHTAGDLFPPPLEEWAGPTEGDHMGAEAGHTQQQPPSSLRPGREAAAAAAPPAVLGLQLSALIDHVARVDWSLLDRVSGDRGGSQQVPFLLLPSFPPSLPPSLQPRPAQTYSYNSLRFNCSMFNRPCNSHRLKSQQSQFDLAMPGLVESVTLYAV
jgi:hypothetical protein